MNNFFEDYGNRYGGPNDRLIPPPCDLTIEEQKAKYLAKLADAQQEVKRLEKSKARELARIDNLKRKLEGFHG